jgi:hypothetical protein
MPHVLGTRIETDATGATAVPGLWVEGNVSNVQGQVVSSAVAGLAAGAAINAELIAEDTRRAVDHHPRRGRARPSLSRSERSPDQLLGDQVDAEEN